jgi:hypothetical protein
MQTTEVLNNDLYEAMLAHKQKVFNREQSIAGDSRCVSEANAKRRAQAEEAASVVTASTHYQNNTRYAFPFCATWDSNPESLAHKTNALTITPVALCF